MPKPRRTMVRTNVFLAREQHAQLATVSAASGIPMAELIRQGIELVLIQQERMMPIYADLARQRKR